MRNITDEEIFEEIMLPNVLEQWHVFLVLMGNKTNSTIKEIASILENFEGYESKFDIQKRNGFRKNHEDNVNSKSNNDQEENLNIRSCS